MKKLGIYIHIPYCIKKCPYCDFNSYGLGEIEGPMPEESYVQALLTELEVHLKDPYWANRKCHSVFFGGGTPSLFSGSSIEKILLKLKDSFEFLPETEVTLEANPGTLRESLALAKLQHFRAAGVNRLSFGAQSFSARKLKGLGRVHYAEDIPRAVELTKNAGFDNFNIDLIFGYREETIEEWITDLNQALELNPNHLSIYNLTIEPGTEFGRLAKKGADLQVTEELQSEFFVTTQAVLTAAGFKQYEISNYATAENECRHNLNYWDRANGEYLGLGAGAHSFMNSTVAAPYGVRWRDIPGPTDYISTLQNGSYKKHLIEQLTREQAMIEYLSLRLRTRDGVDKQEFEIMFNEDFDELFGAMCSEFVSKALIENSPNKLNLTNSGFLFCNSIVEEFVELI
jgi:oxygen-independent coproporphyrinogen-3 oxidase